MPCEFGLAICLCFLLTRGPVLLGLGWGKRRGERGAGREVWARGRALVWRPDMRDHTYPPKMRGGECGGGIRMVLITL